MSRVLLIDDGVRTTLEPLSDGPADIGFLASAGVALHRIPLFETRPRAMLAEARARAADLTAAEPSALFVALGPREADGAAWVAFAEPEAVARAIDAAAAAGHDLRHLVPAPLALPVTGGAMRAEHGGASWLRDPAVGAVLEPALADALLADASVTEADALGSVTMAAAPFALDLRQGPFRRRVRWWLQRAWRRRIAALAGLAVVLAAAPPLVTALRDRAAIDRTDKTTLAAARRSGVAVGPETRAAAAAEMLAERRERSDPCAAAARVASLAQAVAQSGGARLTLLAVASDGSVVGALAGTPAAAERVLAALRVRGLSPESAGNGVTLRRPRLPAAATERAAAEARAAKADADAAALAAAGRRSVEPLPEMRAALADALLEPPAVALNADAGGATVGFAAARAPVALGLVAGAAARGLVLESATLSTNADATLRGTMRWRRP